MSGSTFVSAPATSDILFLDKPIQLQENKIFHGCNRYHNRTVIRQRVNLGCLSGVTNAVLNVSFADDFITKFGGLSSLLPNNGISEEFIARLRSVEGVDFSHILFEAVLAVETAANFAMHELNKIAYAQLEQHADSVDLIWTCKIPKISRMVAEVAVLGVMELLPSHFSARLQETLTFEDALAKLISAANRRRLSPTTSVLQLAAQKRDLPCTVVGRQHLRIGEGKWQQAVYSSMTNSTSVTAQKVCADKHLSHRRLAELRLPVPEQAKVSSSKAAHAAADKMGFPIVVKPLSGKKGGGVTAGLNSHEFIDKAFERAHHSGADVIIERFIPGADHRLLVIGGKFVAALTRLPPAITGDGESTVAQLIERLNANPYRNGFLGFKVEKDLELRRLLQQANLSMDSILDSGRTVALRTAANVSTGGTSIDLTEKVHPDNREMAERAAKGMGLDVAGIDFMTTDIAKSYREVGGGIIEINARPGLCMHTWPEIGQGRNVAGEVLKLFFPPGHSGRVPVVAVTGDRGTGTVARYLEAILRGAKRHVALSLREQAFVNGISAELSEKQQAKAALTLLGDPDVDTLISTVSLRKAAQRGLQLEHCHVAIIIDKSLEGEAELFQTGLDIIQRATSDYFVLSSANHAVLEHLCHTNREQFILVNQRINDPVLQSHVNAGYKAVSTMWIDGETRIVLLFDQTIIASFPAKDTSSLRAQRNNKTRLLQRKMFAIAAAFGLGLSPKAINKALNTLPNIV